MIRGLLIFLVSLSFTIFAQANAQAICAPRAEGDPLAFELEPVLSGFYEPTFVTNAGDGSGRLFVTEKEGRVWIVKNGRRDPRPFLDIRKKVDVAGEQGLLSLVFHPDYLRNGRFFIFYNTPGPKENVLSVVAEYRVSANPNKAAIREKVILTVEQLEFPIHKGGQLSFGPDGYLYVSLGDSDGGDVAQNLDTLYGKVLRLDIDSAKKPYAIPPDNPFVGVKGARAEIWAYGFRNPWRFSFDPCTGQLTLADVGTSTFEEIDFVLPGKNYGWPAYEGVLCQRPKGPYNCDVVEAERPDHWLGHLTIDAEGGNGIIGGYVYRGSRHPQLRGRYIFGDTASRRVWVLARAEDKPSRAASRWRQQIVARVEEPLTSFGLDQAGEIYALGYWEGILYRLTRKAFDPIEGNLAVTARPKTIALTNFSALYGGSGIRGTGRWRQGLGPRSSLEVYLDKPGQLALYFELLGEHPGYALEVKFNGRVVAPPRRLDQSLLFDWLALPGRRGQNSLVFEYKRVNGEQDRLTSRATPPAFTFRELELERLGSAK